MDTIFDVLVLVRWAHFTSMFVLFGCSFFWLYIGSRRWAESPDGLPWTVCRTTALIRVAAPIAAVSGIAWLATSIANMTGAFAGVIDPETVHAFFFETPFGAMAIARLVLLAGTVIITIVAVGAWLRFAATAAVAALLLASQAWLGHAAEGGSTLYGDLMVLAYAAHVIAGAAWVGGLPPLLLAIIELRRRGEADLNARTLRLLLRYSMMATVAASVVIVSAVANTVFHVAATPFRTLLMTPYGEVLLAKLGVVTIMLVLAALNRFVIIPRLSGSPEPQVLLGKVRETILIEGFLGIAVIGLAAVLGITPPPE